tara:strand:- start:47 stop:661 length:615 start_codon:yes stop_codon:yes gene_type:complete
MIGLNASQARAQSQQDMIIYDEVQAIMKAVITASGSGLYETTVSDATTMTESTPVQSITGSVSTPATTSGNTFIFNGTTVILGTSGTVFNGIVADINDAGITGLVASKVGGFLNLEYTAPAGLTWTYDIGAGTANTELGLTAGVVTMTTPTSITYYTVWQGTSTDRAKGLQMDEVIKHFGNLGYKLERTINTVTGTTLKWYIYW